MRCRRRACRHGLVASSRHREDSAGTSAWLHWSGCCPPVCPPGGYEACCREPAAPLRRRWSERGLRPIPDGSIRCSILIRPSMLPMREAGFLRDGTIVRMCGDADAPGSRWRMHRWWLVCGIVVVLCVVVAIPAMRLVRSDPCDTLLPFAAELGLRLSANEEVVTCVWHSSFPDSWGGATVRTASAATREALLRRSGVAEELERTMVSENDGPFYEKVRSPNLERSRQVYES